MSDFPEIPESGVFSSLELATQYRRLRNILELADGFELVFAVARGHALSRVLNLGTCDPPDGRAPYLIDVATSGEAKDLPQRLAGLNAGRRKAVVAYVAVRGGGENLQHTMGSCFAILNEQRNCFIRDHPHPVVILGDAWLPRVMQERAPDLWSVRSHVLFFPDIKTGNAGALREFESLEEANGTESDRPGAELEELAEAYSGSDKESDLRAAVSLLHRAAKAYLSESDTERALDVLNSKGASLLEKMGDRGLAVRGEGIRADCHEALGNPGEALRIRREVELPYFEAEGDAREEAVTWGKIADVLYQQGDYEEAQRIRREKELPVYQRLGDAREEAVTWGKIADVLYRQEDYEEAQRIRRDKQLPVFQRLGDAREEAVARAKLGMVLAKLEDLEAAASEIRESLRIFEKLGLEREAEQVQEMMAQLRIES